MMKMNNFNQSNHRPTDQNRHLSPETIVPYRAIPNDTLETIARAYKLENIDSLSFTNNEKDISKRWMLSQVNKCLDILRTYYGEELNQSAYRAAALGVINDNYLSVVGNEQQNIYSGIALADYFQKKTPEGVSPTSVEENIYIAGLLDDRKRLNLLRQKMKSGEVEESYQLPPSAREWLDDPQIMSPDDLYSTITSINIESILISGAETLRDLQESGNDDTRQLLDKVRYAEQVVSPIAEVMGLDTLAMSLNSITKQIRLKRGGRFDMLSGAESVINRFRDYEEEGTTCANVAGVVGGTLSTLFGEDTASQIKLRMPVKCNNVNETIYGDSETEIINIDGVDIPVAWRYRLKTVGSLAWKLFKASQHSDHLPTPMDVLAITAVVKDIDDQVVLFDKIANQIYQSNVLTPKAAPTKKAPIHIRGVKEYIEKMKSNINEMLPIDESITSTDRALNLGKVTVFYDGVLPIEIQCVTRQTRDSMQTGHLAHVIYKTNHGEQLERAEVDKWVNLLADIHGRRNRIGEARLLEIEMPDGSDGNYSRQLAVNYIEDKLKIKSSVNRTMGFIAMGGKDELVLPEE